MKAMIKKNKDNEQDNRGNEQSNKVIDENGFSINSEVGVKYSDGHTEYVKLSEIQEALKDELGEKSVENIINDDSLDKAEKYDKLALLTIRYIEKKNSLPSNTIQEINDKDAERLIQEQEYEQYMQSYSDILTPFGMASLKNKDIMLLRRALRLSLTSILLAIYSNISFESILGNINIAMAVSTIGTVVEVYSILLLMKISKRIMQRIFDDEEDSQRKEK